MTALISIFWASTFFDRVIKSAMSGDGTNHPNG